MDYKIVMRIKGEQKMKCIMCNKQSGSIIHGLKQNYLVCSKCLKKYKPGFENKLERVTAIQIDILDRLREYLREV